MNSYGCGHSPKTTEECLSRSCNGVVKYHFIREGDCRECKQGGNLVTRGKEGKGRYAQELKRRDAPSPVARRPLTPISTNTKASPWAPPKPRERPWHSPVRRHADDLWLEEHAMRERDLEAKSKENASRGSRSPPKQDFLSPHARDQRRRDDEALRLRENARKVEDVERIRVRPQADRSNSYGSHGNYSSMDSSPRGRSFDSGFHPSASPYVYEISPHHRLGHGLEDAVRDSTRKWSRR